MNTTEYPAVEFHSIDELCALIAKTTDGWDTRWYRGCKSPRFGLRPTLFRDAALAKREGYLGVEFRRRARPHLTNVDTAFEWLCAMQHYSIPTRLLDWTESLAIALYFTVRPLALDLEAPTIWVLNPFELNKLSDPDPKREVIPIAKAAGVLANADLTFEEDNSVGEASQLALPVVPDFLFNRLAMQNGAFTIHGTDERGIEEQVPADRQTMLVKFVAAKSSLSAIYNSIDLIKPSSDAVFPDIEGLKDYIV